MFVLLVFAIGVAVSLAVFFLGRGLAGFTPTFDRQTLNRVGVPGAFALFCGAGPVLLARAIEPASARTPALMLFNTFLATLLIFAWTGAIGIVAVESARLLL